MLVALPLVTLVLLALGGALYVRRRRAAGARPSARVLCWLAVPAAGLVLAAAWCALGLYEGGAAEVLVLCVAALVAGAAALAREKFVACVRSRGEGQPGGAAPTRALVAVVAVLACVVLGFLALELTYNATALSIALNYAAIEASIILGALLVLFFLFQRTSKSPIYNFPHSSIIISTLKRFYFKNSVFFLCRSTIFKYNHTSYIILTLYI